MRTDKTLWLIAFAWLALVSGTLYAMAEYASDEGQAGEVPQVWPAPTAVNLQTEPDKPTVVLFAHPLCPCTRATLWELESVTNRLFGAFNMHILFFQPEDMSTMPAVWEAADLKSIANRLPGAVLHDDIEGSIAKYFGAYTSGQVVLYDSDGQLQFAGGITPSRGHVGNNPGRAALINAVLRDKNVDPLKAVLNPVYGCSLHDESDAERNVSISAIDGYTEL